MNARWSGLRAAGRMAAWAAVLIATAGRAGAVEPVVLGVANDQSSLFSSLGGPGSVLGARMAIEDFGGNVLGRPIEVIVGDTLNKPDVASSFVKEWFERRGVTVVLDGSASSVGLALQVLAKQQNRLYLDTGAVSSEFIGASCTFTTLQFSPNTRGLAIAGLRAPLAAGVKSWFFITVDYAFGNTLQADATEYITRHGGQVVGAAKHPLGTTDMSSYLVAAQASGAEGIVLANAGGDLVNAVKQAHEFGVMPGGPKVVALFMSESEVAALGPELADGLLFTTAVDWGRDAAVRAWVTRFRARHKGQHPTMVHAMTYVATLAYLTAVQNAGTTENEAVARALHDRPIDNLFLRNVAVRADGRVMAPLYLAEANRPEPGGSPEAEPIKVLSSFDAADLYPSAQDSACPLFRTER